MLASIILLTVSVLIFLDSMGSKRIRTGVIHRAKSGFAKSLEEESQVLEKEEALPKVLQQYLENTGTLPGLAGQNIRLKFKGAKRRIKGKRWIPLEAKYFLSRASLQMDFYQDATLGFLCSKKTVSHWSQEQRSYTEHLFSLISKSGEKTAPAADLLLWVGLPWLAEAYLSSSVKWTESSKNQANFQFDLGAKTLYGSCIFGKDTYLKTLVLSLKEGRESEGLVINYQDYKSFENRIVPFAFQLTQNCGKSAWEYQFEVTDIIENEPFAWW